MDLITTGMDEPFLSLNVAVSIFSFDSFKIQDINKLHNSFSFLSCKDHWLALVSKCDMSFFKSLNNIISFRCFRF